MKIDAKVEFNKPKAEALNRDWVRVPVDMDYVEGNNDAVIEWVQNELEEMFGQSFSKEDFEITNLKDIVEDIAFDEFESKMN